MKKRILSILLLCCMVLTLLPTTVLAADGPMDTIPKYDVSIDVYNRTSDISIKDSRSYYIYSSVPDKLRDTWAWDKKIFIKGDKTAPHVFIDGVTDIHPSYLGDLVLLRDVIKGLCLGYEIDHYLLGVLSGEIGHSFTECGVDEDIKRGFLFYLTQSRLDLCLALLNVPLWKRPVTAVNVFYKQYFRVPVVLAIDYCAAGLFIGHICSTSPFPNRILN